MTFIDLTGQQFGRLTVTARAGSRGKGEATWQCACSCGGSAVVSGHSLRSGDTVSCGCYGRELHRVSVAAASIARIRNLAGQRFGRLVAVGRIDDGRWECQCDCGTTSLVMTNKLRSGATQSCGCLPTEQLVKRNQRRKGQPNLARQQAAAGYHAAHHRVQTVYGKASSHACVDCGSPALHWSYKHTDPAALIDTEGRPYSLDPVHYEPRCARCHKRYDINHQATRAIVLANTPTH